MRLRESSVKAGACMYTLSVGWQIALGAPNIASAV